MSYKAPSSFDEQPLPSSSPADSQTPKRLLIAVVIVLGALGILGGLAGWGGYAYWRQIQNSRAMNQLELERTVLTIDLIKLSSDIQVVQRHLDELEMGIEELEAKQQTATGTELEIINQSLVSSKQERTKLKDEISGYEVDRMKLQKELNALSGQ